MSKRKAAPPAISLCMIVRDPADEKLYQCLESVVDHVGEIIVTVANDKPPAPDAVKGLEVGFKAKVSFFEWCDDFSAARNYSFEQASGEWILWLDHDDVVRGADKLAMLVEEANKRGFGAWHLLYEYRHNAKGDVTVVQTRERLLRRSLGWTWKDRVHEFCEASQEHLVGFSDDVVVVHTTDKANTDRNLRLLLLMEEEKPDYPRLMGALGDLYQSQGEWLKSIAYNERLFNIETNEDVRWTAATELARSNQGLQRWDEVIRWCFTAIAVHPEYALPYLLLAHAAWFGQQDAERALLFLRDADERAEAPYTVFRQPEDYTVRRWDIEHRALAAVNRWQDAYELVSQAMQGPVGDDPKWRYFMWFYLERVNMEKSTAAAHQLVDHLFRRGDTLAAVEVLKHLPLTIRTDPRIVTLGQRVTALTAHVFDDGAYKHFYQQEHSSTDDPDHVLNAISVEPYRMDPLIERLRARGARRILDVGCGAGEPAIYLAKAGFSVVGLDINEAAIREARRRAKKAFRGQKWLPVEFRSGTFDTVGPENIGRFDAVVMMELIEHVHPSKVPFYLGSAEDFLNEGGAVFLTTPGMLVGDIPGIWQEFPRDHVKEFTREELEALLVQPTRRARQPMSLFKLYDKQVAVPGFGSWFMEYEVLPETMPENIEWQQPVSIYVGPGLEDWTPETPDEEGLGGSETWAAKTARELRRRRHPVVVYAMADGVWEGVIYRHYSKFDAQRPFAGERAWLCIVSRQLEILDERPNAENVIFVAHDTDYGAALTYQRLENMDVYAVMSEWQREHTLSTYGLESMGEYHGTVVPRLRVIANGIEPSFFEAGEQASGDAPPTSEPIPERRRHSFIWSSSPDRGLDQLLEWWPAIRLMWEDAELHVYYGWQNADALMAGRPYLAAFKEKVEHLARQEGVSWHGRIGQRALARKMQETQFWVYPSRGMFGDPWHETFCITALEAQAGGAIPIIPASGALPERFYFGRMVDSETLDLAEVIDALEAWDHDEALPYIAECQAEVLENTWVRATDLLLAALPQPSQPQGLYVWGEMPQDLDAVTRVLA